MIRVSSLMVQPVVELVFKKVSRYEFEKLRQTSIGKTIRGRIDFTWK